MKRIVLFMAVNILVVATISIILSLLGVGSYMANGTLQFAPLLVFCFVWGLVGSFISLLLSKKMAVWMMGVQLVTDNGPHKDLVDTVHRLARKAGLGEMPEVGIYQSEILNAFATGPTRNNSLVAVSTGLMEAMDTSELEGVLAHEVSHIANGDMVTMALIQGVINAFVMFFSRVLAFFIGQALSDKDNRDSRPNPFIQMLLVFALDLIFGFLAIPIVAGFSRHREFRADKGAADLAGKDKMIAALMALSRAYPPLEMAKEEGNANFKSMQITSKEGFMKFFSTHPPLEERINALKNQFL